MTVDQTAPRSRRALLAGALGGALAAVGASLKAPTVRGADGDNVVLGTTNAATGTTELTAAAANPALRVTGGAIGIQAGGDLGVDAGGKIAVSAVSTDGAGLGAIGWSQANTAGILGWSTSGTQATPTIPANTGVHGVAEQDASARGVFGRTTAGQGVRGEATTGIGVAAVSDSGPAIDARSNSSAGVIGVGPSGAIPNPLVVLPGVYGAADAHPGVFGSSASGYGVRGDGATGDGVYGLANANGTDPHASHGGGVGVHGHGGQAGVLGTHDTGYGVQAASQSAPALYAANTSATVGSVVADGGPGTAVHGHGSGGTIPPSPALTGIFGSAAGTGVAIAAASASGLAVSAQSSLGHAVRGRGQLDGVIGESATGRSGIVGKPVIERRRLLFTPDATVTRWYFVSVPSASRTHG